MKCSYCNGADTKAIDSRPADDNSSIHRHRQCERYGKRLTTYEKLEIIPSMVIKKDNSRETYDRSEIEAGIIHSYHKRPASPQQVSSMIDEIENQVFSVEEKEMPASAIGELVTGELKDLNEVAYVRFTSVYRGFKDTNTFINRIGKLLKRQNCQNRLEGILINMLEMFYPHHYKASTYVISFDYYYTQGIQGVIFNIDNTLVPHDVPADGQAMELFEWFRVIRMKTCLLSDNKEPRIKSFVDSVDSCCIHKAGGPRVKRYKKAIKPVGASKEHTLFVGDQLLTDIYGANRASLYSILIRPMNPKEEIQTVTKRYLERPVPYFYKEHVRDISQYRK